MVKEMVEVFINTLMGMNFVETGRMTKSFTGITSFTKDDSSRDDSKEMR